MFGPSFEIQVAMKLKASKLITVLLFLLVAFGTQLLAQSESFYGAYQNCPFGCETIQINPDGTFVHQLDGDLFNDRRTKGTWQLVGKTKIKAVSVPVNTEPQVTETEAKPTGGFLVTLIDAVGGLVPSAKVSGVVTGVAFERKTNAEGVAEIPECKQFNVAFGGSRNYHRMYKIKNPRANVFTITLTIEQMSETYIDEIWQIEKGCLYFVESDGLLNREYCLKKLNRKKAKRIFGR